MGAIFTFTEALKYEKKVMNMLKNKKILLGVSGGIAAFKSAALTSKLVQAGAEVRVVMSESATKFVTPMTFQALSHYEVYTDTFTENNPENISHIHLADWADLVVIAPATANTIGKIANGLADNMLTSTILASKAPLFIFPAMNSHMLENKAVARNIEILKMDGYHIFESDFGYLAEGYAGKGRMQEPESIISQIENFFDSNLLFAGKKVLITAGPTIEKIDPVRFISNFSSGKMGYALAVEAKKMGAEVTLVSGPVHLAPLTGIRTISIHSAAEMFDAVIDQFDSVDVVIGAAAVADYSPNFSEMKIKKNNDELTIELHKTTDIIKTLGDKKTKQFIVGFAAETNDMDENAKGKLVRKNADLFVANDVTRDGAGFNTDTNIVTIFSNDAKPIKLPLMSKNEVAREILQQIATRLN
jgi:phosphopantothenoylcysteine decarboxylase/phosphopantothenate--cysteine ligase